MADIIFLHGASSSGKTTLARALQARIDSPFWHMSIDHFRDSGMLPTSRFQNGDFDWKTSRGTVFDGFHAAVAACAGAGNNLILEHILDTHGWVADLKRLLVGHDVLFVALHCPVDVLRVRELARGDRPVGSAEHDAATIHLGRRYDLELDTTDELEANLGAVLSTWRGRKRRSEFHDPPS